MAPQDKVIVYVTREIERALGITPSQRFRIVSNRTSYGETVQKQYPDFVTLIEPPVEKLLGTTELLESPITAKLMEDLASASPYILVFKNTLRVETVIKAKNWRVLNPNSSLSERVENKISQIRWLGPLGTKYLPPHAIKPAKNITLKGSEPFIVQWAHGHTGDGTMLIKTADDLRAIQEKFPERMARVTSFVKGPSFTVNAVVTGNRVLMGNVSYQITGLPPFTDNEYSTIGNDWSAAAASLTQNDRATMEAMVAEIGARMQAEGWRGLFGVDAIKDEKSGRMYLIEVNARQPASTTFESALQEAARHNGASGLTTFEAHLRALQGLPIDQDMIAVADGAQVIQRVTKKVQSIFEDIRGILEKADYKVVVYQNTAMNSDLIRIQSDHGIMESHGAWNAKGREIAEAIKSSHFNIEV